MKGGYKYLEIKGIGTRSDESEMVRKRKENKATIEYNVLVFRREFIM